MGLRGFIQVSAQQNSRIQAITVVTPVRGTGQALHLGRWTCAGPDLNVVEYRRRGERGYDCCRGAPRSSNEVIGSYPHISNCGKSDIETEKTGLEDRTLLGELPSCSMENSRIQPLRGARGRYLRIPSFPGSDHSGARSAGKAGVWGGVGDGDSFTEPTR